MKIKRGRAFLVRKGAQFWVNMIIKLTNTNTKSVQALLLIFDTAGNFLMKEFNANKLFLCKS